MVAPKKTFMTVGQIDATGVRGPHEKELEEISKAKHSLFINIDKNRLEKIAREDLGCKLENIGFNEDWTLTVEMFPEINVHMTFTYFGDEFGGGPQAEFRFYFSGERVFWVPGEDSATYIDILMEFLERKLKKQEPFEKNYDRKTDLMKKVLVQRSEPFKLLKEADKDELAKFLGAKVWKTTNGWRIKKELFPSIFTEIVWENQSGLDIIFSGDNLSKNISSYHGELVGIFAINHVLRYITWKNSEKALPDICYMMFSRMYSKQKDWDHKRK